MKKFLHTLILVLAVQAVFAQFPCQAYWTYTTDSNANNLNLFDQSFNMDSTPIVISSYDWTLTYGGGTYTFTTANPIVQIPPAFSGPILVCLTINTPTPCTSTYCDTVYWGSPPVACQADFYYVNNSFLGDIDFYDISTAGNPLATITNWTWTFVGGTPASSNLQNPSVTFPGNGNYQVCLNIVTDSGCSSTWCDYVYINDSMNTNCQLNLNAVVTNVTVIGGSDGAIELNVTGGTPPYSYLWSTGATTEDIYGLPSGLYTLNVSQADTTCPDYSATFQLTEPYDSIPIDTLLMLIDTCLNFVPDSFYVTIINVDSSSVTVTWTFMGQGGVQNITVVYAYSVYGNYVIVLSINCDSAKNLITYMTYINITSNFGMEELSPEDLIIYPNPVGNTFRIEVPENAAGIQIFNNLGQLYYSNISASAGTFTIDASSWPAGIYLVRLSTEQNQLVTKKVIKN